MADIKLTISVKSEAAAKKIQDFAKAQDGVERSTRKAARATKTMERDTNALDNSFRGAIKSTIALGAGFLSFQKGIDLLRDYNERLKAISKTQNELTKISKPLETLMGPGATQIATGLGIKQGLTPQQSIPTFQSIASIKGFDTPELKESAFNTVARLVEQGAGEDAALQAVKISSDKARGLSPERAGSLFEKGAQESPLELERFIGQASGVSLFADAETGLAVLAGLAETQIPVEQLGTSLRQLGLKLGGVGKFTDFLAKEAKKQGKNFEKLDEIEKLQLIKDVIPDVTASSLQKKGLTEQRAVIAVVNAIPQLEGIKSKRENIRGVETGALQQNVEAGRLTESGKAEFEARQVEAVRIAQTQFGEGAPKARAAQARRAQAGAVLGFEGIGVNQETGQANLMGEILAAFIEIKNSMAALFQSPIDPESGKIRGIVSDGSQESTTAVAVLEKISETLIKQGNTMQGIEENTGSSATNSAKPTLGAHEE